MSHRGAPKVGRTESWASPVRTSRDAGPTGRTPPGWAQSARWCGPQAARDRRLANLFYLRRPSPNWAGANSHPEPVREGVRTTTGRGAQLARGLQRAETTLGSLPHPRASCRLKRVMPIPPRPSPPPPRERQCRDKGHTGAGRDLRGVHMFTHGFVENWHHSVVPPLPHQAPTVTPLDLALPRLELLYRNI